ncbi:MAG: hypothetical protein GEU93_02170 [Propionibacteriales bacterium]|nr:hypothetical protein [Propionibacteriales bacterium]
MARNRQLRPADALLVPAVQESVKALKLGPEDSAAVALALDLARSLDEMGGELHTKMLAQTSGQLLRVLEHLHDRSTAVPGPQRMSELDRLREARAAVDARRR